MRIRNAKKLAIHFGVDAERQVAVMLKRQNLTGLPYSQRSVPGGAIGWLGSGTTSETGNLAFFTGLPIRGPSFEDLTDADTAARLLPTCDGAFVGVFWDDIRQRLVIVTDCLGMQPLYMRHAQGQLTIVSETKALNGEPDLAAWGAFISIGHPIGARSLMAKLERVPPARILTYDAATDQLHIRRYWQWPEPDNAWHEENYLGALERDIRAYVALGNPGTLLLSGGFDSRLLLGLLRRAQIPANALIVAHTDEHGDADGRLAEKVARVANVRYRKASPPANFFSSAAYLDYLRACDAGFPSLDLFIAKVASRIDSAAVWDGLVPGFVFMPLHQPEGGFPVYLNQEIRGPGSPAWRAAERVFRPEVVKAMQDGFTADIEAETARLPQNAQGLARFVIENRSRNRAGMNPLKVYAGHSNAFIPGLSKDFLSHALTIPFHAKQGGRFYQRLFTQLDPRLAAIPFLSGGDLVAGTHAGLAYHHERLRANVEHLRARHPRVFPGTRVVTSRSTFLGPHLLEGRDNCLDPGLSAYLATAHAEDHAVWKLLFHWKAWQWLHSGQLSAKLEPHAAPTDP